ncbi:MAG: hypothetical protein FWB96_08290 [Defluviitaleaceae bacterium]|nr:hypothetical protein [Defluviitaleaceae bacterium]MCL2224949.1 hypothetical protein [Defluviitaleaceae bacterium]MCL2262490.1 hypothetical protein [Defluviitaleaceae bacterium]
MQQQSGQKPPLNGVREEDSSAMGENATNSYLALEAKHQKEVNQFPFFFAFGDEQFEKELAKLGLTLDDTDKICRLDDIGAFCLKSNAPKLKEMFARHERERKEAIAADTTGHGYIYEMFLYELANYEYCYTNDLTDTLNAIGITRKEISEDKALSAGFEKAIAKIRKLEA